LGTPAKNGLGLKAQAFEIIDTAREEARSAAIGAVDAGAVAWIERSEIRVRCSRISLTLNAGYELAPEDSPCRSPRRPATS
jgi:hypothetical protein